MKMRTTLSIMASLLTFIIVGSISAVLLVYDEKVLIENKKENQIILFENFAKVAEDALVLDDTLLLADFCTMMKQTNPSISYIIFRDNLGSIISTGKNEMVYFATRKLGKKGVKTVQGYLLREITGPQGEEIVDFSTDIKVNSRLAGTAQIGFSKAVIRKELATVIQKLRKTVLVVAMGAFLIGIAGSMLFANRMMRPIRQLAEGAGRIGAGELDYRIPVHSHDELGWLAGEFNRMGEKLQELDQMKNDFVSNVTHELRSPLGAIQSYVNVMTKQPSLSAEFQEYFGRIQHNVQRLSAFIDNLLNTARIEQGQFQLSIHPISVSVIAGEVIKNFDEQAKEKKIVIESRIPSVIPDAAADKGALEQVLTNLISNALKFTPAGGRITVDAQEITRSRAPHFDGRYVRVEVSDTGCGIAAHDLKRIFNKFEQVRTAEGPHHPGTGLGLSIVKSIIEQMGGNIWVQSRLGKGTTFYFTLAVAAKKTAVI